MLKEADQLTDTLCDGLFSLTHKITYKYHITALGYLLANAANELQCYRIG